MVLTVDFYAGKGKHICILEFWNWEIGKWKHCEF